MDALIARSSVHVQESLVHDTSSCAEAEIKYNHGVSALLCQDTFLFPVSIVNSSSGNVETAPVSRAWFDCAGYLSIDCAATGLSLIMSFKDNTAVKGQVSRQLGPRRIPIAQISGKWSEQILVQCPAKQTNDSPLEGEGSFTTLSLLEQTSLFLLG